MRDKHISLIDHRRVIYEPDEYACLPLCFFDYRHQIETNKKSIMRLTAFLIPALAAFVPALAQNDTDTEESGYVSNVLEALK